MLANTIATFFALGVFHMACAADLYDFRLDTARQDVSILRGGNVQRVCRFDRKIEFSKSSFDGSALIVSATEYVSVKELLACDHNPVKLLRIPSSVGSLVDINLAQKLYLAVDLISVSPLSFLATVARIGGSRSIVDIPGSYNSSLSLSQLQKFGFSYDESRARGKISLDGNYVSPNGEINCGVHAYPGVWDIKHNRRVIVPESVHVQGDDAGTEWCRSLFNKPPRAAK